MRIKLKKLTLVDMYDAFVNSIHKQQRSSGPGFWSWFSVWCASPAPHHKAPGLSFGTEVPEGEDEGSSLS